MRLLVLIILFFGPFFSFSQLYDLTWGKLENSVLNGNTISHASTISKVASATSQEVLYGEGKTDSPFGYIEFTQYNNFEIKKIGLIDLSDQSSLKNSVHYGFSFLKDGTFKAFGPDIASAALSYSSNDNFKIERTLEGMYFYRNNQLVFTTPTDVARSLNARVLIYSPSGSFSGVSASFNSLSIVPTVQIDNITKSISINASGGVYPYVFNWVLGDLNSPELLKRVPLNEFSPKTSGLYSLSVKDQLGSEVIRTYLIGQDLVWQNFYNSHLSSGQLVVSSNVDGWASATGAVFAAGKVQLEYIVQSTVGRKGFGFSPTLQSVIPREMLGGFVLKGDLVQIIFEGNVLASLSISNKDVLRLERDSKGNIHWFKNEKRMLSKEVSFQGMLYPVGFVRQGGELSSLTFLDESLVYVSKSWNDSLGNGAISVSMNGVSSLQFPVQYKISKEPINELLTDYLFFKDSLNVDVDSASFFSGSENSLVKTFSQLAMGDYYVAVFDNTGKRVYSDKVHLQPNIEFLNQIGLASENLMIYTTNELGKGDLALFLPSKANAKIDFQMPVIDDRTETYFGLKSIETKLNNLEDIYYGFKIEGRRAYFLENKSTSQEYIRVSNDDKLTIGLTEDYVVFLQNGKEHKRISKNYDNQMNVGMKTLNNYPVLTSYWEDFAFSPYSFSAKILQNLNCSLSNWGKFTFSIFGESIPWVEVSSSPHLIKKKWIFGGYPSPTVSYVVTHVSSNTVVQSGQMTINQSILVAGNSAAPLLPGKYRIRYQIGNGYWQTKYIYLGYEVIWKGALNYSVNNNSIVKMSPFSNSSPPASAVSRNRTFDGTGWVKFVPKVINQSTGTLGEQMFSSLNQLKFNYPFSTSTSSSFYTLFGKLPNHTDPIVCFLDPQVNFFQNQTIGKDRDLVLEYTPDSVKVYEYYNYQNHLKISHSLSSLPPIPFGLKGFSWGMDNGFLNTVTSFPCRKPVMLYAEPTREVNSTEYEAFNNEVLFFFDSEYLGDDLMLNYEVYSSINRVTPVFTGVTQGKIVKFGDNRYRLNVQGISAGKYILIIENDKKEKFYLRFKK